MTTVEIGQTGKQPAYLSLFWRYIAIAVLLWTAAIGGSLIWNLHLLDEQFAELAHKEAVAHFNKDQAFRLWGTKHGGVYVPVTEETPPSPYMAHIPERDIETPSGRRLTLMNPAYMVRQLMEDYSELYGVRGRITGLVVLRPGNAPDPWERQALIQLEAGADEVMEDAEIDGEPYHRLMRPMYMEEGCVKCHGHLGFKTGDFRGGVGVSVPLAPYIAARQEGAGLLAISHSLIWLLGLGGIGFGARQVRGRIEERDRASEQIEGQRARFETLLNLAPDAFIVIDEEHRIRLFSQGASNAFGYRPEEVMGEPVELLMPEDRRTTHGQHLRNFAASGQTTQLIGERGEVIGRRKDGSTFPAEASVATLELAGETLFTATLRDVTERKERDEMVLQAQRMEAVGQLTGGIAHDFNNLLAIVLGNLDIIDSKLPADSELKALIEPALRAVDRGASLTQRLLAFSRRQTLQVSAVDAGELLGGLSEMLGRSLGEDIDIELKVEPELWLCETDSGQLEQAVLNLANNARDAMPRGGRLAIDVANNTLDAAAAARIDDAKPGDYVTISVADEGAGIAPEVMERIFEPFFSTKQTGKGTGLGLSMVYGFVTQSGGYLTAESKIGEGTRIQLCLPRCADAVAVSAPPPAARPLAAGTGETVLVVEDDPDIRKMVGHMVSKLGYETLVAGTGSEALTLLKDGASIDLLLTDVILAGGMNGAELAREAGRIVAGLKVVYMSGYAGDALAGRIEIGDEATLLRKPFHTAELADRLHSAFGPQGGPPASTFVAP